MRYICANCGYIYDPEQSASAGEWLGTPFEELPPDWVCPLCYVGKDAFDPVD